MKENGDGERSTEKKKWKFPGWLKTTACVLGLAVVVGIAIGALVNATSSLDRRTSDPVQFVTGNLLNFLIVLAILGQIYIYRSQWAVMKKQLKSSDAHSRNSLRAYVNIRAGSVAIMEANPATAQIEVVNFGQTPANYVRTFIKAEIRRVDNPPPIPTVADIPADEGDGIPMAPSMAVGRVVQTDHDVTAEEWEFVTQGRAYLFVWGVISYKTIFSRRHFTSFIWRNAYPYPHSGLAPWREGNKAT
jgi:uncharacterized membrane protein YidH (DUF202 family)